MASIRLRYLPVNIAWCFTFGDSDVSTLSVISMNGRRLFDSKAEAIDEAKQVGLTVDRKTGLVS